MSAWIRMLSDEEAGEDLREALALARTPHGTVDNVMRVHSLRPNTLHGHVVLYRATLHDDANTLPAWLQECIASYVSILNDCAYALANHWANARHLIGDDERAARIEAALAAHRPEDAFEGRELALMRYAEKLTLRPGAMERSDVDKMRAAGLDDGEVLEANQIVGYFNYVNRCLNGLGVTTEGDVVGYYTEG
ncbi:MAG: peroxidase-related enzyme [Immundisolibacterales bacterium]|nr:peroxidase-related enzyme [Immundisolibacterales bacterium]